MIGAWILATTPVTPQSPEPAPLPGQGIDQIAFLVGGTWVSVPTPDSTSIVEETCSWGPGNQSILTVVVIRSGSEISGNGQGGFDWDAVNLQILCHSIIEQAGIEQQMVGHQTPFVGSNNQWHFVAEIVVGSKVEQRRMTLTQLGPDEMRVDQSLIQDGKLVPLASVTYVRRV